MNHLRTACFAAVPLRILELKARGGPSDDDIRSCRYISELLGEKGHLLMFRGKKRGETAEVFNQLARGLAILSFVPGGVTFLGEHWISGDANRNDAEIGQCE